MSVKKPSGSVSGVVEDRSGLPVPSHLILYQKGARNGFPTLFAKCAADTKPDGSFACPAVPPGKYLVVVYPTTSFPVTLVSPSPAGTALSAEPTQAYGVTYYPASSDFDDASALTVRAGEDSTAQILLEARRTHTIAVELPVNTAASSVLLAAESEESDLNLRIPVDRDTKSGKYLVKDLHDGRYVVKGDWFSNGTDHHGLLNLTVNASTEPDQHLRESIPVPVGGSLFSSDTLVKTLPGVLIMDSVPEDIYHRHYEARTTPEGSFAFPSIEPGRYYLSFGKGDRVYVAGVQQNGKEVEQTFSIPNAAPRQTLRVEIGLNPATLSGVVSDGGRPVADAGIVIRSVLSGQVTTVTSTDNGLFQADGLAPGQYQVMAWKNLPDLPYRSPLFWKRVVQKATVVTLAGGERSSLLDLALNENTP